MNQLDDANYSAWTTQILQTSVEDLNNLLKQLATLDFTLVSAYLGLWNQITIYGFFRTLICLFLMAALAFCIIGMYPFGMNSSFSTQEELQQVVRRAASVKRVWLILAAVSLVTAFLFFWFARIVS